jgi:sugar phosphate isomerase/epimerase
MKLYLAIDNCFAAKRWCEVGEWMRLIYDLGLRYVEASADNEIDPLYSCESHLALWRDEVLRESGRLGMRVANCYSGHGTYSTLGLSHHDARVREHLRRDWMQVMIRTAASLGAGLGFFAHAFSEKVLRDRALYLQVYARLAEDIRELARFAAGAGLRSFGIEQMYTPHQVPWTLDGTADFLRRTNDNSGGLPVYITDDTGHQHGQARFLRPSEEELSAFIKSVDKGQRSGVYLGPRECYAGFEGLVRNGAGLAELQAAVERFSQEMPHLFSEPCDSDPYLWLQRYGCFSPIIHLQQTDGTESAHRCFTAEHNAKGIISAPELLKAILRGVRHPAPAGFPPKVTEIYLTLEPFLATACHSRVMLEDIAESIAYWRKYVPEDGMEIEEAVERIGGS